MTLFAIPLATTGAPGALFTLFIVPVMDGWIAPKQLKGESHFADERRTAPPQARPTPACRRRRATARSAARH